MVRATGKYISAFNATAYWIEFNHLNVTSSYGPQNYWYAYPIRCLAY